MSLNNLAAKLVPAGEAGRLSESVLWTWQRAYFEREGLDAWRSGTVPHHITCSPVLADAYVDILFGLLRDNPYNPGQPVYIVELGAGSGRLGYLILRRLLDKLKAFPLKGVRIKYVLTDFTLQNVEYWRPHGWLQNFVEQGVLDFARFDAETSCELKLMSSGETISPGSLKNPLAVIANYVFDSIPQDAFRIRGGRLFETLVRVSSPEHESAPTFEYSYREADEEYYENAEWNDILREYCRRMSDADFLFPVAAMRCIGNLDRLAGSRLTLLSADRGYKCDDPILEGEGPQEIAWHGSFSMPVDYRIIGRYFLHRDGHALHPDHRHVNLNVLAFLPDGSGNEYFETRIAFDYAVGRFGPDDFFTLKEGIEKICATLTLDEIVAFIRLSSWDYLRFLNCLPVLRERLDKAAPSQKIELLGLIRKVWESYFPIGEEEDLAFQMGDLLMRMQYYGEAIEFFGHSGGLYGPRHRTILNTGICHYALGEFGEARICIDNAIALDPKSELAQELLRELQNASGPDASFC